MNVNVGDTVACSCEAGCKLGGVVEEIIKDTDGKVIVRVKDIGPLRHYRIVKRKYFNQPGEAVCIKLP